MYKALIRPLLFLISPETVHNWVVILVKCLYRIPGCPYLIRHYTYGRDQNVTMAGLQFRNRVGLAAGFDKNADFYHEFSLFGFSFIEIGTVTPLPQPGNPKPRLFRLAGDHALINRMGFNNKGVDYAVKQLEKPHGSLIVGGNIGKNTATPNEKAAQDYAVCFEHLYNYVDYFTVNVSCPNIAGMEKLQDQDSLREILTQVTQIRAKQPVRKPVFLKISPDLTHNQIDEAIELVEETKLDGIIATNTSTRRDGLLSPENQIAQIGSGGLSGKPLTTRTVEIISYICNKSSGRIPVIAVGGIMTADDAVAMIKAGATLLQLYTGFIYEGPLLVRRINKAMERAII